MYSKLRLQGQRSCAFHLSSRQWWQGVESPVNSLAFHPAVSNHPSSIIIRAYWRRSAKYHVISRKRKAWSDNISPFWCTVYHLSFYTNESRYERQEFGLISSWGFRSVMNSGEIRTCIGIRCSFRYNIFTACYQLGLQCLLWLSSPICAWHQRPGDGMHQSRPLSSLACTLFLPYSLQVQLLPRAVRDFNNS